MRQLLFLPGAGADPSFWRPVGDRLPHDWSKVYLGWPGLGHQAAVKGVASFDDLVRLTEQALPPTPVDLLAQSMAGALAIAVSLRNPQRVRRLVLSVTALGMDLARFGAVDWRPGYRAEYPKSAAWLYDARPDYAGELHRISQPTLLLWGDQDPISPVAVGLALKQALPQASLHVVPGGTHALINEQPEAVVDLIREHLAS